MILGVYEILIAIVFLIPGLERIALPLLVPHLFVTTAPLFLLREITWQAPLIPTIEGQYIIKNIFNCCNCGRNRCAFTSNETFKVVYSDHSSQIG